MAGDQGVGHNLGWVALISIGDGYLQGAGLRAVGVVVDPEDLVRRDREGLGQRQEVRVDAAPPVAQRRHALDATQA